MGNPGDYLLCFFDVETTGHDPLKLVENKLVMWHEIIEIGAIFADSETLDIRGEFGVIVKPEHPERCLPGLVNHYPERVLRGEWDKAISLDKAIKSLLVFCGRLNNCSILTGHNLSFDWSFMSVALAYCDIMEEEWRKRFHYSRLDTRSMAVQELLLANEPYNPEAFSLRNDVLAEKLGIPKEPYPHEALNGARQSYLVYKKLRELKAAL